MKKSIIVVFAVAILIIGVFILTSESAKSPKPAVSSVVTTNTINYTDNGFEPASIQVKAGSMVTVNNNSSNSLQFSSDNHPTHTKDPELNQSVLASGKSETFKVTKTGTNGYHDHLNTSHTGTITVE